MGKFSRDKGRRGEREVIDALLPIVEAVYAELREQGLDVGDTPELKRNTLQSDRGGDDVAGVPGFSFEVKNCATLQLGAWWEQCVAQTSLHDRAVLLYKVPRRGWRCRTTVDVKLHYSTISILADLDMESFLILFRQWLYEHVGRDAWRRAQLAELFP